MSVKKLDTTFRNLENIRPSPLALCQAATNNNPKEVERILSSGVYVDFKNVDNHTSLYLAARKNKGESHLSVMKVLLKNGADVNFSDNFGVRPIHYLARNASVNVLRLLLSYNVKLNVKDAAGETPLFYVKNSTPKATQLLLDNGLDVNLRGWMGRTALHPVSEHGKLKTIKCLIKNGADVNALSAEGRTPLMHMLRWFCSENSEKKLSFFMKYADVNTVDSYGNNILSPDDWGPLILNINRESIWKIILEHIAKLRTLGIAVHPDLIKEISISQEYNGYFEKCTDELKVARNTKLKNCWITFFNLLVDSKIKLKNYAGNEDLIEGFEKSECVKKFPIYGASMVKNMEKGIRTRKLFDKSSGMLSDCLPCFSPTHLVIRNILDCLTLKDYNFFVTSV